jgi:hypothetical protein
VYEAFSILSGVAAIVCGFLPTTSVRDRALCLGCGVAFIAYGIYVAQASSGYFVFPALIFVIPFLAIFLVLKELLKRSETPNGMPVRESATPRRSIDTPDEQIAWKRVDTRVSAPAASSLEEKYGVVAAEGDV